MMGFFTNQNEELGEIITKRCWFYQTPAPHVTTKGNPTLHKCPPWNLVGSRILDLRDVYGIFHGGFWTQWWLFMSWILLASSSYSNIKRLHTKQYTHPFKTNFDFWSSKQVSTTHTNFLSRRKFSLETRGAKTVEPSPGGRVFNRAIGWYYLVILLLLPRKLYLNEVAFVSASLL